ncbi:hypothetical protein [Pradoshia sp.]|uniref:hypothetical protein n=1 Tax=Pradoshia sp. TaxID=2651281 RepID=UPI003F066DC1
MNKRIGISIILFLAILSTLYFAFFEKGSTEKKEEAAQSVQRKEENRVKEVEVVTESEKQKAYIVFEGYYYMKTGEVVPESSSVWKKVGEVKRIGDWKIKKSGDSNEVPPGPIYQMEGKDKSLIVAKGAYFEDGVNKEGYLLFKKDKEVTETNPDTIQSAVSDTDELSIAFNNAKKKFTDFYAFKNDGHYTLQLLNSSENYDAIKMIYLLPKEGENILVLEYRDKMPLDSAFHKKRKPPTEQNSLEINRKNWTIYKDDEDNYVAVTSSNQTHYEVQFAGDVELSFVEESLNLFDKVN